MTNSKTTRTIGKHTYTCILAVSSQIVDKQESTEDALFWHHKGHVHTCGSIRITAMSRHCCEAGRYGKCTILSSREPCANIRKHTYSGGVLPNARKARMYRKFTILASHGPCAHMRKYMHYGGSPPVAARRKCAKTASFGAQREHMRTYANILKYTYSGGVPPMFGKREFTENGPFCAQRTIWDIGFGTDLGHRIWDGFGTDLGHRIWNGFGT